MTFPDVMGLLIAYLDPIVAPIPVVSRVPDPRPDELVQVRRVGGLAEIPVKDNARVDVFCWASTDLAAMDTALIVREAMWAVHGNDDLGVQTYQVEEFLGPRLDDDPNTRSPRVWATYQLTVRADDVTPATPVL